MGYVNLVFFMLFPFLCHLSFSSSLPHLCPKHQALPLLQFKHMFTVSHDAFDNCFDATGQWIPSYPKTLSWNKSTDCCSWDGVYCDETTGQVIELNLTCSKLQGKFHSNSSVFQLSNLKRLDLSNNNFSGSLISPKFGEFSSLTHLDLSYSNFTGLIPVEISYLSKLHVLRIQSYSDCLRFKPHNFELLLKNLTQLRELDFDGVNISSTIPLNFSSYLTALHLRGTQLYGTLPKGVFHLYNLESLYLTDNPQLTVRFPTTK
ncbi:receptor-like protein Cf-9 [Solanum stenotomum]|uniref:receptor-like protein Cf-9 n=1 Tax=Solanum stenotomum TaxID=172797 RepID=UPI0020D199F6|nr:receptor-like protein Cf-9 [Solanum stenotomum]